MLPSSPSQAAHRYGSAGSWSGRTAGHEWDNFETGLASSLLLEVTLVINYDVPASREPLDGTPRPFRLSSSIQRTPPYRAYRWATARFYLHRIGRSGRFGRRGVAVNLVRLQRCFQLSTTLQLLKTSEDRGRGAHQGSGEVLCRLDTGPTETHNWDPQRKRRFRTARSCPRTLRAS